MVEKKIKNKSKRTSVRKPKVNRLSNSETTNIPPESNISHIKEDILTLVDSRNDSIFVEQTEIIEESFSPSKKSYSFLDTKSTFSKYIPWVLIVFFLSLSLYFWPQAFTFNNIKTSDEEIIKSVGKIIILPNNEIPNIVTIAEGDLNNMKTQAFFANAMIGDKVLIYPNSGRVILYNPKLDKIVEVSNVDLDKVN